MLLHLLLLATALAGPPDNILGVKLGEKCSTSQRMVHLRTETLDGQVLGTYKPRFSPAGMGPIRLLHEYLFCWSDAFYELNASFIGEPAPLIEYLTSVWGAPVVADDDVYTWTAPGVESLVAVSARRFVFREPATTALVWDAVAHEAQQNP